jgi:hypothetical protein
MTARFHTGELEVQALAGVREQAARLGRSIHAAIPAAAREFLQAQRLAVIGSVGRDGGVWASLLAGEPGFLRAPEERTLQIEAAPLPGDPLREHLEPGAPIGVLAIELESRRRMRLNGQLTRRLPGGGFEVEASEVYSNCPKYIQKREIAGEWAAGAPGPEAPRIGDRLSTEQRRWIERADTFFLASFHPERGADASHRGGMPGFARASSGRTLEFPDYSGNNLFQTLGNLAVNPKAGLLFLDFERGSTLQLTGEASIDWTSQRRAQLAGAERVVDFRIERVVELTGAVPLRWRLVEPSPFNPA